MSLLIERGVVYTGPGGEVIEDGAVLMDGDRVARVGASATLRAQHPDAARLDAHGQLVTPGLVNAHMHLYSTFARGMAVPGPAPTTFVEILERLWWRLDRALTPDDLYASAVIPLCDGLRAGVTSIVDHHASPRCARGSLTTLARAALDTGVRAALCYETSDRDGPDATDAGLAENLDFAAFARGRPTLAALFGLHASFTLGDATLARIADSRGPLGIHVHVAEARSDEEDALARSGGRERVIARLARFGLLDHRSVLAHGVHLDANEVAACASTGATLVHNPQSNANNAVGWGRFTERRDAGVRVAIGSDGMTSVILDEARMALLMARHELGEPAAAWGAVERSLLVENPALASRVFGASLGRLEAGAQADVVVWRYVPPTPVFVSGFLGHALFGLVQSEACDVFVAGRHALDAGRVRGVDEALARAEAKVLAEHLWRRL